MKLTITTTKDIEMPKHFKMGDWYYQSNGDTFTMVKIGKDVLIQTANPDEIGLSDEEILNHQPITEAEFKEIFCKAVAMAAKFDVCEKETVKFNNEFIVGATYKTKIGEILRFIKYYEDGGSLFECISPAEGFPQLKGGSIGYDASYFGDYFTLISEPIKSDELHLSDVQK